MISRREFLTRAGALAAAAPLLPMLTHEEAKATTVPVSQDTLLYKVACPVKIIYPFVDSSFLQLNLSNEINFWVAEGGSFYFINGYLSLPPSDSRQRLWTLTYFVPVISSVDNRAVRTEVAGFMFGENIEYITQVCRRESFKTFNVTSPLIHCRDSDSVELGDKATDSISALQNMVEKAYNDVEEDPIYWFYRAHPKVLLDC
jgi:hypothetical protein